MFCKSSGNADLKKPSNNKLFSCWFLSNAFFTLPRNLLKFSTASPRGLCAARAASIPDLERRGVARKPPHTPLSGCGARCGRPRRGRGADTTSAPPGRVPSAQQPSREWDRAAWHGHHDRVMRAACRARCVRPSSVARTPRSCTAARVPSAPRPSRAWDSAA